MQWKLAVKLLLMHVLMLGTTFTILKGNSQDATQPPHGRPIVATPMTQLPVVDFTAPAPANEVRQERNNRHNSADLKARVLNDMMPEEAFELPISHQPPEKALPASESDAVVIGSATEARAYLSADKTNIYSEISITVEDILKDNPQSLLSVGAQIDADRKGGAVRLPSGKILKRGFVGKGIPAVGSRYVFFLRYHDDGKDYSIITLYELKNNIVFPSDVLSGHGNEKYLHMIGADFLNEVRAAISQEKGGHQ